jgi:hypothetical protein
LRTGSAPIAALQAEVAVLGLAVLFVAPAFIYLYALQQRQRLAVTEESEDLVRAVAQENAVATGATAGPPPRGSRLVAAAIIGTAATGMVRDAVTRRRRAS